MLVIYYSLLVLFIIIENNFVSCHDKNNVSLNENQISIRNKKPIEPNFKEKDKDVWHKFWFYSTIVVYCILLLLAVVILKLIQNKRFQNFIAPLLVKSGFS